MKLNMIKTSFILFLFLLTTNTYAQSASDEIKSTFTHYFEVVQSKDNDKTLDYVYPKLFTMVPRETLKQALDQMYSPTSGFLIDMQGGKIESISEVLEHEGGQYALLDYHFKMTMRFTTVISDSSDATNPLMLTYEMLKTQYDEKSLEVDKETSTIIISSINTLYAIKEPAYEGWKFIEKKENMAMLINQLLPQAIIDKL